MPKEKLDSLALKKVLKPRKVVPFNHSVLSSSSAKQNKTGVILGDYSSGILPNSKKLHVFEIGDGVDDFGGLPFVVRKDRLVQEIENSLAEIEDHYSNASKLEEERTAVEMERNNLLKDIEETITEIQNHVLNSSGLEAEKNALKDECDGLRDQVDQLKTVLGVSASLENGSDADEMEKRTSALKAEINTLTLENEKLKINLKDTEEGELSSDMMSRELELLQDENSNLQKLLQIAEESEEKMAKELKSYQAKLTEVQKQNGDLKKETRRLATEKEQMELDQEDLEEELNSLKMHLKTNGDLNQNHLMLKESKEDFAKAQKKCAALEKENSALNKRIDKLEREIQNLQDQEGEEVIVSGVTTKTAENGKQLKSALEKLNKETSMLHQSLEKAEKEIECLKDELKIEREEKEKLKAGASENGKKKKSKKEKEKVNESSKDGEDKSEEVEAFKKEIYNLKSECQALSETIAMTANEKRKLTNDVQGLTEEKTKLESKVKELEGVVSGLSKVKSENEELKGSYSNLRVFHDDLARKLEVAKKSNSEKDDSLKRTLSEKDAVELQCKQFQETVDTIRKELQSSQLDLSSKDDELEVLKRKFEEQKKEFSTASERGRKEKEKLRVEIREMSEMLKGKEEEMNTVLQAHSTKGSELQNLRITVDEMRKELKLTKNSLRESEETRLLAEKNAQKSEKTVEELQKSNAVINDMVMEKSLELSRTRRNLEKKVEKLTKENAEMHKKFGLEIPFGSPTPPRLSPVTVQMQKIPTLDVNLDHLSRPSQRPRNDGAKGHTREYSPSPHGTTANGPTSDARMWGSHVDDDFGSDRQLQESEYRKQSGSKEVPSAIRSEYRVVASEVVSAPPPKREFTSSVVHVASRVREQSPVTGRPDFGSDQRRDEEWSRNGRRLEERRLDERKRSSDNTNIQESSEAAFQVVGYRKPGGNVYEHWV